MAILKVFSLLGLLAGIVIATYLYVSSVNKSTQTPNSNGSSSQTPIDAAGGAVNNFNQRSQEQLQQAQSQYGQ